MNKSIDNGKYECGIFIDLRKAFNTVNREILLNKLAGFLHSLENLENLEKHSNFTSVREKNWELREVREKSGNFINRS